MIIIENKQTRIWKKNGKRRTFWSVDEIVNTAAYRDREMI